MLLTGKAEKGSGEITPKVKEVTGIARSDKPDDELLLEALVSKYR
jgi:hypothetical protein